MIHCAAEHNVAIEINNTTLLGNSRVGSVERCYDIAEVAKKAGAFITTGSDAHYCNDVGNLNLVKSLLNQVGVAPEQVITSSVQRFTSFLELRGRDRIEVFNTL
ncbi:putative histidinol phosphatase and related hydrolases of the PHP family [Vibrio astriarenae]|nr:putative histidinol phosphatase and related hydrolases of the PHP family [Vibrio sp. C7]